MDLTPYRGQLRIVGSLSTVSLTIQNIGSPIDSAVYFIQEDFNGGIYLRLIKDLDRDVSKYKKIENGVTFILETVAKH